MTTNFKFNGFLKVLIPFLLTQALGIYAAFRFLPALATVQPVSFGGFSFYDFLILLIFVVLFIFLASRFQKFGAVFYKVILTFLIFGGSQAIFGIWLGLAASILASVILTVLFWFFQTVFMQDIAMILTLAGIGSIFGLSFAPTAVLLILIIFSFYDIIAVYKTGHMIKLAESMIRSHAIFGLVIPSSLGGLKERMSRVAPGEEFMILGSGDVIFPLLLSASIVRISIAQAAMVGIFSAVGLFLMYWLFTHQKVRKPMAALPPIAGASIVGYLIALLIFK